MTGAAEVLAHVLARPARLGEVRMLCIDGPSGSGKSTLATQIAELTEATMVRTDDLCPGWDGLGQVPRILVSLAVQILRNGSGTYPRYDWILAEPAEDVVVSPGPLLIVEGVGAGARLLESWRSALVWTDADTAVRRTRALTRDGEYFEPFWDDWARAEDAFYTENDVRAQADLTIRT